MATQDDFREVANHAARILHWLNDHLTGANYPSADAISDVEVQMAILAVHTSRVGLPCPQTSVFRDLRRSGTYADHERDDLWHELTAIFRAARFFIPQELPPGGWDFSIPGGFTFDGTFFSLKTLQQWQLLRAFVEAKKHTLTHVQINSAASEWADSRHYTYVSELNKSLRKCWKLKRNPIRPIRLVGYRLHPPNEEK